MNALASYQKSQAQQRAANASADILEGNAHIAEQAGADSVLRGQLAEGRVRMDAAQVAGKQTAAYAAAGVDVKSGSALDVLGDTGMLSELDAATVRANAAREAWGYRTQAYQFRRRAALERQAGQDAAEGTILGGIANIGKYLPGLRAGGDSGGYAGPSHTDFNDQGI